MPNNKYITVHDKAMTIEETDKETNRKLQMMTKYL